MDMPFENKNNELLIRPSLIGFAMIEQFQSIHFQHVFLCVDYSLGPLGLADFPMLLVAEMVSLLAPVYHLLEIFPCIGLTIRGHIVLFG